MQQPKPQRPTRATDGSLARDLFNAPELPGVYGRVESAAAAGYSVIPLRGNRARNYDEGKTPAVKWTPYQHHAADEQERYEWFVVQGFSAYGIMCGRVSRLAVLDFDDLEKLAAFRQQLPDLADTHEVRTGKRGAQFYYELTDDLLNLQTTAVKGIGELRANGAYVVGAGSEIDGAIWTTANDRPPRKLGKHDPAIIRQFIGADVSQAAPDAPLIVLPPPLGADELAAIYQTCRETMSRNPSAYTTALKARGALIPADDTLAALAAVFVTDPAPDGHAEQTAEARYTELQRTVASAYGVKPSSLSAEYVTDGRGLPNSVREKLLQTKQANAARVLDMLYMTGLQPGQRFTEKAARECGVIIGIGHATIRKALDWLEGIQGDITVLRTGAGVAGAPCASSSQDSFGTELPIYTVRADITMLCIWQLGSKTHTGRPTKTYTLPDPAELAAVLNVQMTPADKLEITDLKSAKAYRVGMQRALVKRSEDMPLGRQWQANRLGVSVRTVYSYDESAGIEAIPDYVKTPLDWSNVERVPVDPMDAKFGQYLQVGNQKLPPRRKIATDALARKISIEYVQRTANKYRLKPQDDGFNALAESLGAVIQKGGA